MLLTAVSAVNRDLAEVLHERAGMTQARVQLGKSGEDLACRELERRGYAILARRYRRRRGEVDIIARDGPTLVFVEVKARDGNCFGEPTEAVTGLKRLRLRKLATDYIMRQHVRECPCRFDVVSIHFDGERPVVEIFQNAFDARTP
jgi:putative endonuclease